MNAHDEDGGAGDHPEDNDDGNPIHVPPNSVHSSCYRVHIDSLMLFIHGGLEEQYTSAKLYRKSELNEPVQMLVAAASQ